MMHILKKLKESGDLASFVIGGAPNNPIDGKVLEVKTDSVIIETAVDGTKYRYLMHPDNVVIVERK
ncbi:hypothetical protein [Syntrophorhabdus aromaticivorans]|jgi:hypothetical protein|uniref:Uncharacterized protein n=1 Tax=Syntrophorhabdus aromaticivorans TaxID=328301 RepID=A0A351U1E7_9BACT|nr:hypothetical protein [Syntrophorhabdus aromaticivorans]NLW35770.1 hypothetical protein [Syntrophorhabdus aromaticivorans]HBA53778.1 hypothetical protein [Syntrophorhabdus aromaticivorans]